MKIIINMRKRSTSKHDNCSDLVNFQFLLFNLHFRIKRSPGIFNFLLTTFKTVTSQ